MIPPSTTTGKLPFWATIAQAYALPFEHIAAVLRITWAWALLLALGTGLLYRLLDDTQIAAMQKGDDLGPAGLSLVSLLLGLIVGSSVAVGWHRLVLLDERPTGRTYLRLDNTVWGYIAVAGLLLVIMLPFLIAAFLMAQVGSEFTPKPGQPPPEISGRYALLFLALILGMVAAFLLTTRLALVLPARAIDDHTLSLGDSWRLTRGSFWRLFGGTLICYLPTLVLAAIFAGLLGNEGSGSSAYIASVMVSSMIGLVTSVFSLGYLALAYRHLVGRGAGTNSV
ncbi:MAG: hypothetical protein ACKVP7_06175 [Hyphomicrobiaceae bacterium]